MKKIVFRVKFSLKNKKRCDRIPQWIDLRHCLAGRRTDGKEVRPVNGKTNAEKRTGAVLRGYRMLSSMSGIQGELTLTRLSSRAKRK